MRERGEAIQIKGYIGKDYEQVFDDSGKAIGKKDADGNFIPYKARGRPTVKEVKARNLQEKKTNQQANMVGLEDMLNDEVTKREGTVVQVPKRRYQAARDSSNSEYDMP